MGLFSHLAGGMTGGLLGSGAGGAGKASAAQEEYIRKAIDELQGAYGEQKNLWNPYINFGNQAMGGISALNSGDYSGFQNSPDYKYALDQGLSAVNANAGKMGNLFSGARATALNDRAQGLATQNLGNYRNSLMGQLGVGVQGTNALSGALQNRAQGVASAYTGIGDAKASGYVNQANGSQNMFGNLMNMGGQIFGGYLGGGGSFSDRRLKSNIKRIGTHASGLPWYSYEIFGAPSEGVMADEVLAVKPAAVSLHPSGYLTVNYGAL